MWAIPAFALMVLIAACELNDSVSNTQAERPVGVLSPRILASAGVLEKVDSVHLRLWLDSLTAPDVFAAVDVPWSARSATIDKVPLHRKWFVEVYGTTGSDTVWYGSDTGTLVDSLGVVHSSSSPSVVVQSFVGLPSAYCKGKPLNHGSKLNIGDTVEFRAPDSAHLGIADAGLPPNCTTLDSGVRRMVMVAEGGYGVSLVACSEGRWNSRVLELGWSAALRDSISTVETAPSGEWMPWTHQFHLAASNGLSVVWRAQALSDSVEPVVSDWSALDARTDFDGQSATIDSTKIKSLISAALDRKDSVGRILVKAWARRGDSLVDSIGLWWKVRIPVVRKPVVAHDRLIGGVRFSWEVNASTRGTKVWKWNGTEWSLATPSRSDTMDVLLLDGLPANKLVRIKLQGFDSATGRESDTVWDSATTRNPPPPVVFSVVNSRTDSAYATVSLAMDTAGLEGIDWSIAYGPSYTNSMSFSRSANLVTHPWVQQIGEGLFVFVVRATRDDSTVFDTAWCEIKGAASNRPQMPQNLRLVRRTTDSLIWQWNANPDRAYSVYWGNDRQQTLTPSQLANLAAGTGQFAQKLSAGDSSWIAVFAQPGGDSTAGESIGAFSEIATTRKIPAAPSGFAVNIGFDVQWQPDRILLSWNSVGGMRYVVSDSLGKVDTTSAGKSGEQRAVEPTRGVYTYFLQALNGDSVLSAPVRASVRLPGIIQIDPAAWSTWIAGDSVRFRLVGSVSPAPDSLRIVAPWAVDKSWRDVAIAFPRAGGLQSLAFDSSILRGTPELVFQYRWSNGNYSPRTSIPLSYHAPTLPVVFDVGSGESGDTVSFDASQIPAGWRLEYTVHSLANGWESVGGSGVYGSGVDSIRGRLIRSASATPTDTTLLATGPIDHRKSVEIVLRDGSKQSVLATRISGLTWMGENLNYDIPNDTFDVCYMHDPASCSTKGRQYSVSQILSLSGGRTCDTLDWTNSGSVSCDAGPVGVCPVGWRLPTSADWESLGRISVGGNSPKYRTGRWPGGTVPEMDPFGLGVVWPGWCYRQGENFGCYDSTIGAVFLASDPSYPGTVSGAYFDVGDAQPILSAMIGYFNPEDAPRATSYFPVRCVKE